MVERVFLLRKKWDDEFILYEDIYYIFVVVYDRNSVNSPSDIYLSKQKYG
jgi:hypothetical protein